MTDSLSAAFSICGDSHRVNCVVDGDTVWFNGQKIRIVDIDTPELSPPRCDAVLIDEGLARSWDGARHGWCQGL
ncbi:hypothetical protein [Rhizobium leguminosarum]|jgi:hypothetical protein|uniref:hypothetical protein n=1 Tax=Rhizobium leguminosarum TaxID=384 RepID=UPI001F2B8070|nr:hypothetical protein LZK78_24475 [Rhizobium leguminosarum]